MAASARRSIAPPEIPCYPLSITNHSMEAVTAMPKQPKSKPKESNYVITLRSEICPAIAANVFRRSTPDGHLYLDFEISRAWKSGNREGYSSRFYARNREGIKEVADLASDWIEKNPQAADGPVSPGSDGRPRFSATAPLQRQ